MIEIDGPLCFAGSLLICGAHLLHLRAWRREYRSALAWWKCYDATSQKRHDAFMQALSRGSSNTHGWNLDGSRERGQA